MSNVSLIHPSEAVGEAGHVGAGHAARALEQMTGQGSSLQPPRVGTGVRPVGVLEIGLRLSGALPGEILINLNTPAVRHLVECLGGSYPEDLTRLKLEEQSLLKEVANVVGCAYLTALSDMTGLRFEPSVPHLRVGGRLDPETHRLWVASRLRGRSDAEAEVVLVLDGESMDRIAEALESCL